MRTTSGPHRLRRSILVAAALGALAMGLAGCDAGQPRTVASYCSYLYGQGGQLRSRWMQVDAHAEQEPLEAVGMALSAPSELASFMHQLALRSPDEVQPAVEMLAGTFKHEAESETSAFSDPIGALGGDLVAGLAATGAEQQFNEYTQRNCGSPPS